MLSVFFVIDPEKSDLQIICKIAVCVISLISVQRRYNPYSFKMKLFLWYLLYYHHLFYSHISFYSKTSFIHYIHGDEAFDDDSNAIIDLLVLHDSGKKQLRVTSVRLSDIGANSCTGDEFALTEYFHAVNYGYSSQRVYRKQTSTFPLKVN